MPASLTSTLSLFAKVGQQVAFQICALTTGAPPPETDVRIIAILGDPDQRNDIELTILFKGQFIPLKFNEHGVVIFEETLLNQCALLFVTFTNNGEFLFQLDLVRAADRLNLTVTAEED